jgi:hypothetical protein
MNTHNRTAKLVGALFLTAMAASLLGAGLVESSITAPDILAAVAENKSQLTVGLLLELVNALAVAAIGVLMLPILRLHNDNMAHGYLGFRTIEAVFCSAIVIGPLSLLLLSQNDLQAGVLGAASIGAVEALAMAGRASIANLLIPVFFCMGAFLLYTAAYQARFLPRFISVWGLLAVALVLTLNLVSLFVEFNLSVTMIFALPIILNEIVMGIWLIVKGFNPVASAPASASTEKLTVVGQGATL